MKELRCPICDEFIGLVEDVVNVEDFPFIAMLCKNRPHRKMLKSKDLNNKISIDFYMAPFDFKKFFEGKKTYITTIAAICYALGGWVAGYLEPVLAIGIILGALGLGSIRAAISKLLGIEVPKTTPPAPGYQQP